MGGRRGEVIIGSGELCSFAGGGLSSQLREGFRPTAWAGYGGRCFPVIFHIVRKIVMRYVEMLNQAERRYCNINSD